MNKERLREKLMKRIEKTDSCWNWLAYVTPTGYGVFTSRISGKLENRRAHRAVYELLVGKVPDGLQLDHLCRNRKCVNPEHLEPVTQKENLLRGIGFGAINSKKKKCPKGHKYTKENTYVYPNNKWRNCKICRRVNNKARKERLKNKL